MDQTDRARFDNAIAKMLYATNGTAKPSPTIITTYWSVLKAVAWSDVVRGMTEAVNHATGHVSPAMLSNLCRPPPPDEFEASEHRAHNLEQRLNQADRNAEVAGEKRFGELWFDSEFRDVLRVANMDYARRCSGKMPGGVRIPTPDIYGYSGAFDYGAVVQVMVLPKGKTANDASAAWECFWCVLAEEFQKYQDAL